jgi:pSer/pThr/pTyr-binding forkhead associated (FHA) protein
MYNNSDLGTVNGTFVNGIRLANPREMSDPVLVRNGDIIHIAHFRFKVKYYDHPSLSDTRKDEPQNKNVEPIIRDPQRVAYKIRHEPIRTVSIIP